MEFFIHLIIGLVALIVLVKGADFFVESASRIAKRFGISDFVIGLTLVALGTSLPELATAVSASLFHSSGIVLGNVIGSNISNIALILGVTTIFAVIKTHKQVLRRDGYLMLFFTFLILIFMLNYTISTVEAVILLVLYVTYILFIFSYPEEEEDKLGFTEFLKYFVRFRYITTLYSLKRDKVAKKKSEFEKEILHDVAIFIIAGIVLVAGARYVVGEAIWLAGYFNIPDSILGFTFIAIGTSLPELAVTVSAARKNLGDLAIGNILGSNISNILLIIGISGLISPLTLAVETLYSMVFLVVLSVIILVFIKTGWKVSRKEGIALLCFYILFVALIIIGYVR